MEKNRKKFGKQIRRIAPDAIEKLKRYSWPGNIRELDHILERAIILATSDTITSELLPLEVGDSAYSFLPNMSDLPFKEAQLRFKRKYFSDLLSKAGGNKTKAADLAGIDRTVLYEHLRKVGLIESRNKD